MGAELAARRLFQTTPRLAGGFHLLDPERIGQEDFEAAATRAGKRCGKGARYSDIEFAMLRELGHCPIPVATTVHHAQLVTDFPLKPNDLPLSVICTPTETIRVDQPLPAPTGYRLVTAE